MAELFPSSLMPVVFHTDETVLMVRQRLKKLTRAVIGHDTV